MHNLKKTHLALALAVTGALALSGCGDKGAEGEQAAKTAKVAKVEVVHLESFGRGEMLAFTCVGCHGQQGISNGPATPSLGGMSKTYFVDSMKAYREGTRPSTIMTRIAKGYTDEDFAAMADYFSAQKFKKSPYNMSSNKDLIAKGQKIHSNYCEKCHAENGTDPADDAGFLKGQLGHYVAWSIEDVMSGAREVDKKMVKKLEEVQANEGTDGLKALLEFYTSK